MRVSSVVSAVLIGLMAGGSLPLDAATPPAGKKKSPASAVTGLTPQERAEHAVARLTFGATPGLVEEVQRAGVDAWIDQQLNPGRIDDSRLQAMLANLPAMKLPSQQLFTKFPPNSMVRALERGNANFAIPNDPTERVIYENQIAYIREREDKKQAAAAANGVTAASNGASAPQMQAAAAKPSPAAKMQPVAQNTAAVSPTNNPDELTPEEKQHVQQERTQLLNTYSAADRYAMLMKMTPGEPRRVLQKLSPQERERLADGLTPEQKEVVAALAAPERVVSGEMMEQKLLFDVYSQRQLLEVMTDFWLNHFNVYLRKNEYAPWAIATYERDVIRPHAMGKFEDLLKATAESPAMMEYLDNSQSIGPDSVAVQRAKMRQQNGQQRGVTTPAANKMVDRGLNENYARELMELHTLGVDGGYTQKDVTEVAKVFTGWTVDKPGQGGQFQFDQNRHEPGTKSVLGKTISENGQQEGLQVLHMLAMSPQTAKHLSRQLAVKFVSDNPPQPLVDRMSATYLKSNGDIREVLKTMFTSPEFWSRDAYRAKVKTPLEFVVSSIRATNTDASHPAALINAMNQLGMPLYGQQPPTGYSNANDAWVSSASLIGRMNFALALAAGKLQQLPCDSQSLAMSPANAPAGEIEQHLETTLLNGTASERTRQTVLKEMEDLPGQERNITQAAQQFAQAGPQRMASDPIFNPARKKNGGADELPTVTTPQGQVTEASVAAGLLLGSPEFQKR